MRIFLSLCFLSLLFVSCEDESGAVSKKATIQGRWELVEARKNNIVTGVVQGLYFEFWPNDSLATNLMGNDSPGTYLKTGDEIVTEGVKLPLTFSIQGMTDSTLDLRSKFRGFQFDFQMERAVPEGQDVES
ncbi:hypothetical protein FUA23_18205 [Neolewinella aurantiaca]|uniref:Lipocalin-like domain-containing protein n=1 Tax=Neolewinella aurantiaca TaxID=2602767 RepID=A0A5C7FMM2_9BACT|nr:hypothetical protein [Neolewinella aurantiaca]TXF87634.1 hypothetical protein FUA23_18205 [Neolewinella aurantiaca]